MKMYINHVGIISPSLQASGELMVPGADENRLVCIEPDYTAWIPAQQLRRMSRIIKMGTSAAVMAARALPNKPDAIIAGTGYGCLEDTATFLTKITELNEVALNPTPFMQSTHNTIAAQIALLLSCQGYNQTYVHGALSFEHALMDAQLLFAENQASQILVGGVDELTTPSHTIHSRFNKYRKAPSTKMFDPLGEGTWAGEGASFFSVTSKPENSSVAIADVLTFTTTNEEKALRQVAEFLHQHNLSAGAIDFLLTGKNGDAKHDAFFDHLITTCFTASSIGVYKHLCGEYTTSTAFATALAYKILQEQQVPETVLQHARATALKNVLIYNTYQQHHALILLTV